MNFTLVGAGGHARALVEGLERCGHAVSRYVDPSTAAWLTAEQLENDADVRPDGGPAALGIGGVSPAALECRLEILDAYLDRGFDMPAVVHPDAMVSGHAELGPGVVVLAGAIVQPNTVLGRGVIVNTAAVLEHGSTAEAGSHLAPRALVLGDCNIGETAMIGAGAIVLPGSNVPPRHTVSALARYPR